MKKLFLILGVVVISLAWAGPVLALAAPTLAPSRGEVGIEIYVVAPSGESYPDSSEVYWDGNVVISTWVDSSELTINVPDDARVGRHTVSVKYGGNTSSNAIFTVLVPGAESGNGDNTGGLPAEDNESAANANEDADGDGASGAFSDLKRFPGEELTFQDILKIFNNFTCWILQVTNYLIIILLVYSAWLFFSAGDNVTKGQTARKNFRYVLIGILVVFAAGVIISSVARLAGVDITLVRCIF